jgi:exodeoxyribonuclease-5
LPTSGAWLADPAGKQVFRLFGYAGTGKTTLAKELAEAVKGTVLYATFTGKASLVLRKKGCERRLDDPLADLQGRGQRAHRRSELQPQPGERPGRRSAADRRRGLDGGEDLAKDLLSFGKRILVLGDPAQLPPVKDEGFFINAAPDVMLTEVHRQARDNPIIRMSMEIREGEGCSAAPMATAASFGLRRRVAGRAARAGARRRSAALRAEPDPRPLTIGESAR